MLGIYILVCVLALLVIGLLFCVAFDACEYDRRIIRLEVALREQAGEIRDLHDRLDESFAESYLKPEADG
jgi:cell division protein FtsL